ncbi:YeeE/YedE family protein [Methylotenera sp.]|uniref:YeeE/YedE family protein n=1 Tax=Methylotenera sp. TaxID=2051956 RepID=UPI003454BBED
MKPKKGDVNWRLISIIGLMISPIIYALLKPLPEITITASYWEILIAGLLVGIGTRFGSGCTSGHGICGISRLSIRSVVATIYFTLAGVVTVFITRHLL